MTFPSDEFNYNFLIPQFRIPEILPSNRQNQLKAGTQPIPMLHLTHECLFYAKDSNPVLQTANFPKITLIIERKRSYHTLTSSQTLVMTIISCSHGVQSTSPIPVSTIQQRISGKRQKDEITLPW